jgi:hypothetical protein
VSGSSLAREKLNASDRRANPATRRHISAQLTTELKCPTSVRHQAMCSVASAWGTSTLPGTESGTSVVAKKKELALHSSLFSHRYPDHTRHSPLRTFPPLAAFRSVYCQHTTALHPVLSHYANTAARPLTVLQCTSAQLHCT